MIRIEVNNYHLISGNKILSMHWSERRKWKENLYKLIRYGSSYKQAWTVPDKDRYDVTITRVSPRPLDYDNFVISCKFVLDCIKSCQRKKILGKMTPFLGFGLIWDDSPKYLRAKYLQETGEDKLIIEIKESICHNKHH